ncbi:MAG TPA: alcohol dehydrogenase catalytic domain-containing protein [Vicinamibacterales bacterium]
MSARMKAVVVSEVKADWALQDKTIPAAGPGQVLVRIRACGICGTDLWLAHGTLKFKEFPLILGHEGVGEVVAVGPGVTERKVGDRVGLPMMQKNCGSCDYCRERHANSFVTAANCAAPTLTGVNVDGAHAEYIVAHVDGTVLLPRNISYEHAAPTLCAGYTVWAALRRAAPKPAARVAVVGIGGLGHLAVQYAKYAGFHVTAVTGTADKSTLARKLGADDVVANGAELKAAGGADVLMHTSSSHAAVVSAMDGLKPWGKVVMNGIAEDQMVLPALPLVSNSFQIVGSAHNGLEYLSEALEIVARGAVTPMIEVFPKERVGEAYRRAASGAVRFKSVVTY